MNKEDYIAFAEMFNKLDKSLQNGFIWTGFDTLLTETCRHFKSDNANFDEMEFLTACSS